MNSSSIHGGIGTHIYQFDFAVHKSYSVIEGGVEDVRVLGRDGELGAEARRDRVTPGEYIVTPGLHRKFIG